MNGDFEKMTLTKNYEVSKIEFSIFAKEAFLKKRAAADLSAITNLKNLILQYHHLMHLIYLLSYRNCPISCKHVCGSITTIAENRSIYS